MKKALYLTVVIVCAATILINFFENFGLTSLNSLSFFIRGIRIESLHLILTIVSIIMGIYLVKYINILINKDEENHELDL